MNVASKVSEIIAQPPKVCLDRLLDTAATQFAQHGLDGTSIRTIGREAGLKAPSICYHFSSKDNLYREAFAHKVEQTIDLINSRILAVSDRKQRFSALIEAFFDLFTSDRNLLVLMQRDVIDGSLQNRPFLSKEQYAYFTSLIRRLASEQVGCDISDQTAFTIGAMIFGYCELTFARSRINGTAPQAASQSDKQHLVRAAISLAQGSCA